MANFVEYPQDEFNPNYGDINWKPRLNFLLEATGVGLTPVGYSEAKGTMQVTQENCIIYINQIADELDVIAVKYDQDPEDIWTWYFREKFTTVPLEEVVKAIGAWSMQCITMYPMEHVVKQYEAFNAQDINDFIPDEWDNDPID